MLWNVAASQSCYKSYQGYNTEEKSLLNILCYMCDHTATFLPEIPTNVSAKGNFQCPADLSRGEGRRQISRVYNIYKLLLTSIPCTPSKLQGPHSRHLVLKLHISEISSRRRQRK